MASSFSYVLTSANASAYVHCSPRSLASALFVALIKEALRLSQRKFMASCTGS